MVFVQKSPGRLPRRPYGDVWEGDTLLYVSLGNTVPGLHTNICLTIHGCSCNSVKYKVKPDVHASSTEPWPRLVESPSEVLTTPECECSQGRAELWSGPCSPVPLVSFNEVKIQLVGFSLQGPHWAQALAPHKMSSQRKMSKPILSAFLFISSL